MHEETKRAVETAFGVGFFGGDGRGAAFILLEYVFGLPWLFSSFAGPPSFHNPANQRIVKCWDSVVRVQRSR